MQCVQPLLFQTNNVNVEYKGLSRMTEDVTEIKFEQLNRDVLEIKKQIEGLPDLISRRLNENIELKIENAKKELEMKFYKWIAGAYASVIAVVIGLIVELIKQ